MSTSISEEPTESYLYDDPYNCSSVFTTPPYTNIAIVKEVLSFFSMMACFFVLVFILVMKRWKYFSQRLVLTLIVTVTLVSIASLLNRVDYKNQATPFYNGFCVFGGFLTQVTTLMFVISTLCITLHLFNLIVLNKSSEKYEWVYFFCIIVLPFLVSWIPFIKGAYQRAGVWCWIRSHDAVTCELFEFGQYLQFALLYIPLYAIFLTQCLLYVVILISVTKKKKKLSKIHDRELKKKLRKTRNEVILLVPYPLIFISLNLPHLTNRIYTFLNPGQPSLALWYVSAICVPLQGLFATTVFTIGTRMWYKFKCIELLAALTKKKTKVVEYPAIRNFARESVFISSPISSIDYSTYDQCRV